MNNQVKIFVSVIALLILGVVATVLLRSSAAPAGPGQYDAFAQCLKDKGATFYGAFWCPHCKAQKEEFGSSVQYLPYVECALPDASGQNQLCNDKKIESYPTWEFADGTRLTGTLPLTQLADKTSCALPAGAATTAPVDTGGSSSATSTPAAK